MKHQTLDPIIGLISDLNPHPDEALDPQRVAIASATLERVLRSDARDAASPLAAVASARRRLYARRTGAAILAGVLTVGGASVATGVTPSGINEGVRALTASTPAMLSYGQAAGSAANQLLVIADAAAQAAAHLTPGAYTYVHWQAWTMSGGDNEADAIHPNERWAWLADDGTARTLVVYDGRTGGYKDWPTGGYAQPSTERVTLGADADTAAQALAGVANAADATAHELLDQYTQLAATEGLGADPTDRAAFFSALAATDAVAYGEVTDRSGRTGVAFGGSWTHDGLRDEIRIIVDPTTGQLLAKENIVHGPWILGSPDTVVDYVTYLEATKTDELPACGDLGCETMPPPG